MPLAIASPKPGISIAGHAPGRRHGTTGRTVRRDADARVRTRRRDGHQRGSRHADGNRVLHRNPPIAKGRAVRPLADSYVTDSTGHLCPVEVI